MELNTAEYVTMISVDRLQAYLRDQAQRGHDTVALPPFTAFFHVADSGPDANYAIPDIPIGAEARACAADLQAVFAQRGSVLSFQFLDVFAPNLGAALLAAGLTEVRRSPLMVCTPETYRAPTAPPGLTLKTLSAASSQEEIKENWYVNAQGFEVDPLPPSDAEAKEFRGSLITSRAATALLDGQAVAAGMYTELHEGLTELVGITTLDRFRRRGIGAALTAHLVCTAFAQRAAATFLIATNDHATRVYERVGFRLAARLVVYSDLGTEPIS
jgi:ribosomal protein S18 acetylase RimI-like enzyme